MANILAEMLFRRSGYDPCHQELWIEIPALDWNSFVQVQLQLVLIAGTKILCDFKHDKTS